MNLAGSRASDLEKDYLLRANQPSALYIRSLRIRLDLWTFAKLDMTKIAIDVRGWMKLLAVLTRLTSLNMSLELLDQYHVFDKNGVDQGIGQLKNFLAVVNKVENLTLNLGRVPIAFTKCVASGQWLNLREFRLLWIKTTELQISKFLQSIARTLTRLELSFIGLTGSWQNVFAKIASDCTLSNFVFGLKPGSAARRLQHLHDMQQSFGNSATLSEARHNGEKLYYIAWLGSVATGNR